MLCRELGVLCRDSWFSAWHLWATVDFRSPEVGITENCVDDCCVWCYIIQGYNTTKSWRALGRHGVKLRRSR